MYKSEVRTSFLFCLITLLCLFVRPNVSFIIPDVTVQALSPVGFRVFIKDEIGIELFGFEGEINKYLTLGNSLTVEGDVTFPFESRWTYENLEYTLQLEDTIDFNIFVQHQSLGYYKEGLSYVVNRFVTAPHPIPENYSPNTDELGSSSDGAYCPPSITTYNGGKPACRGHLLFEETFDSSPSLEKWTVEHRLPSIDQEKPFVFYEQKAVKNLGNGLLQIAPKAVSDNRIKNKLDLTVGCTASLTEFCKIEKSIFNIVPPVASGRITTKSLFSFKYGKLEIRAKLPAGNWIYPELYLQPQTSKYGSLGYQSGQIKVAFIRGNDLIEQGGHNIGNKQLGGGLILDVTEPCRSNWIVTKDSSVPWSDAFHTFGLVWTEDSITFEVDGTMYGSVSPPAPNGFRLYAADCQNFNPHAKTWSNGTIFAPFDEEFYLTIGVGVGGVADFSDSIADKKWTNESPKAKYQFYKDKKNWHNTWTASNALLIDSVKVWAN